MPAPRADTPLTPDQVQQATSELLTERDHLSSGTKPTQSASAKAVVITGSTGRKAGRKKRTARVQTGAPPVAPVDTRTAGTGVTQ